MKRPPKEPRFHRGGIAHGDHEHMVMVWVIPDHYQRNARRWKIAERDGKLVRTRSEFGQKIRVLRSKGLKIDRRFNLLANMVLFSIQLELGEVRKSKRRKGRKAVAA